MKGGSGKGRNVCLAVTGMIAVAVVLLTVILALTVFKVKDPVTTVDSVAIKDLDMSLNMWRLRVDLNVTLGVDVSVTNPNKVGIKYSDTTAALNYRGQLIGEAPLLAGEISSEETKGVNLTLTIMADRLLPNSQVYSDVASGALALNAFLNISGEVSLLNFIKVHVVSSSSCDFVLNLSNRTVVDKECQSKTKL